MPNQHAHHSSNANATHNAEMRRAEPTKTHQNTTTSQLAPQNQVRLPKNISNEADNEPFYPPFTWSLPWSRPM